MTTSFQGTLSLDDIDTLVDLILSFDLKGFFFVEGPMGAGKTTLITHLLRKKGIVDNVLSPTYSLIHDYGSLLHADLYRLDHARDVELLGLEFTGDNLLLLEWGWRFKELFQPMCGKLIISPLADDSLLRHYTLTIGSSS